MVAYVAASSAFSTPIFQETATLQRTAPSKTVGVEIELPDFDEMFRRIQAVSPLARLAVQGGGSGEGGGFGAVDDTSEYFYYTSLYIYVHKSISKYELALMSYVSTGLLFLATIYSSSRGTKVEEPTKEQGKACFSN